MADGTGQIPIIACTREAWQFALKHARLFLPAAIIVALICEALPAIFLFSGAAQPQSPSGMLTGELAVMAPAMLASLMFAAAVLRKVIRDEYLGPVGLAFGADELRLLGVFAALMCVVVPFATIVWVVVVFVVLSRLNASQEELQRLMQDPEAMSQALTRALGESGSAAFTLFLMLCFGIAIYIFVRLYVVNAATIGERKAVVFQTWGWSRGNVLRLFAAILLTWAPAYLIESVLFQFAGIVLNSIATEGNAALVITLFKVATTFVAVMLGIPSIALGAILYKGLRPAEFVAR